MMGAFESMGLIGGLVGLAFGVADWMIFVVLVAPKLEQAERKGAWRGRGRMNSLRVLRAAFLFLCFVVMPIIGYVAGRLIGPNFMAAGG